jgi:septum formation inhibitor MinC
VGRRILDREELTQIKEILEKESGVTVARFWCAPDILEEALSESMGFGVAVSPSEVPVRNEIGRAPTAVTHNSSTLDQAGLTGLEQWEAYILETPRAVELDKAPDLHQPAEAPARQQEIAPPTSSPNTGPAGKDVTQPAAAPMQPIGPQWEAVGFYRGNEALLIKTTCRSGEVIRYPGDVVVMADVNPGGEIIADGDILVFGSLRGLAHAGASGDLQATIIALNLDTHRLQIGPYTGVAPKSNRKSKSNRSSPRMAFVRRRSIYVVPYAGRFAGYSGGTLYDG